MYKSQKVRFAFSKYFGNVFKNIVILVIKKKSSSKSLEQRLQNEVTKEIRKNIEERTRGAASKFGETTKMDRKKK